MTDNPTHDLSVHNQWGERYIFMGAMLVMWMFGKLRCGIAGPNPLPGRALIDAVQKIDPGYCIDAPDTFPAGGMLYYDTELVVRFIPPGTPPQFNVLSLPQWRPHEDRADAFSLLCAIKGGFELDRTTYAVWAWADGPYVEGYSKSTFVPCAGDSQQDIEAAACEAIFMAAVEVGRGMA